MTTVRFRAWLELLHDVNRCKGHRRMSIAVSPYELMFGAVACHPCASLSCPDATIPHVSYNPFNTV